MKTALNRIATTFIFACLLAAGFPGSASGISAHYASSAAPVITAVDPDKITNDIDYPIHITGSGFSNTGGMPQVLLGETPLVGVTWESDTSLSATVPWGMAPGIYALTVINPDGEQAHLNNPINVTNGMETWNTGDLTGGPIDELIAVKPQPGLLYAISWAISAIYRSTDYGESWETVGKVYGSGLAVDPFDAQHLFVSSQQSRDGGRTWTPIFTNGYWPGTTKWGLSGIHPYPHQMVKDRIFISAASTNVPILEEEPAGLVRSSDGGKTWKTVQTGIEPGDAHITALAFVPNSDQEMYIGTRMGRIYHSTNNGDTWVKMGAPLDSIGHLWINPFTPDELWATTYNRVSTASRLVKISRSNFSQVTNAWTDRACCTPNTLTFTDAQTAYVATMWSDGWKTTDGGATWQDFEPSTGHPAFVLLPDPWDRARKTFYMADYQYGIQKTVDEGQTWEVSSQGLHALAASSLVVDHKNPARVYALMAGESWPGVFISREGGQHWEFVQPAPGQNLMFHSIAANQDRLFAVGNGAVYRSTDQGKSWDSPIPIPQHPDYPDDFQNGGTLVVDPGSRHTLLISMNLGPKNAPPDVFFNEMFRSTDNGSTWTPVNITKQIGRQVKFYEIEFDPRDSDIVYASGNDAGKGFLLKSTDNGVHWSLVTDSGPFFGDLAIEPIAPYRIFISDWYSTDGGKTWVQMRTPFHLGTLAFVPGTHIIYGGGLTGLAASSDGGKTWSPAQGPLGSSGIMTIALARPDRRYVLYISTNGSAPTAASTATMGWSGAASAPGASLVESGVYRYTRATTPLFLPFVRK